MKTKKQRVLGGFNRYRLMITLVLAVLLPAAALIYVNFAQLRSFERDKVIEAAIRRNFEEMLTLSEKHINKQAYAQVEEARAQFPSPDASADEKEKKLDQILATYPHFSHAFLFDEDGMTFRTQPSEMSDKNVHEEHEKLSDSFSEWFGSHTEGTGFIEELNKRPRHIIFSAGTTKRADGMTVMATGLFVLPDVSSDRVVIGGVTFDPCYLMGNFFPQMLEDSVSRNSNDTDPNRLAMIVYGTDPEGHNLTFAKSTGWDDGKPEITRKMEDVFKNLSLGIKYQGISVQALSDTWMRRSFLILGFLSLMIIGGLVLTKRMVSKEMALAKLKSDFVSNVSHELRTPLALIRLYAETLELGRITTREKMQQYYRIIRKESERLSALINNILDFSRIEAGRKEYEFRETDIAGLVRNTLDSYRYQIEQQGFALEEKIEDDLPAVRVDREAIARALVNLLNNALKYSQGEKYLGVKLYRDNGSVKLEVADRGIGIARRDQTKIFEKFYRAGDPLVHNTKGSGLGLSLVRHISEAHGGQIQVESAPGSGSKFTLSLPIMNGLVTEPRA